MHDNNVKYLTGSGAVEFRGRITYAQGRDAACKVEKYENCGLAARQMRISSA